MARVVTAQSTTAIETALTFRLSARLTAYKSRTFFSLASLTDMGPSYARPEFDTENPLPEAFGVLSTGTHYTASVDRDGTLYLAYEGSSTPVNPDSLTADIKCRPGIFGDYVYFFNGTAWRRIQIDPAALEAGNPSCVLGNVSFYAGTNLGAIYPISLNEAILLEIYEGAIRIVYHTYGTGTETAPGRIFNPATVLTTTEDDHPFLTHFGGACKIGTTIYAYFSQYDGTVLAIKREGKIWSDFITCVPADLSKFLVGNVFAYNNQIFMVGDFQRTEDFASNARRTLLMKSIDGFSFSIDRKTLVSTVGYRFLAALDGTDIIYSASNRYFREIAPYQVIGESTTAVSIPMLDLSGSVNGWSAKCGVGDEVLLSEPIIDTGVFAKLEVGIHDGSSPIPWIKYHDVVIGGIKKGIYDGQRAMELSLLPDAAWHTAMMSHPFYMQILGKSGTHDPLKSFTNLYKLDELTGTPWSLTADFWNVEGNSAGYGEHLASTSTDFWSLDLLTTMADYPEFGPDASYVMNLYGWSRAGKPDTNPNTPDPTSTSADNDNFYGLLEVEDTTGNISTIVTTIGNLVSTHAHPPQTYFTEGVRAGSYPVAYNVPNPGEGSKIRKVGIRVRSSASGRTTFAVERVEMPAITANFLNLTSEKTPGWSLSQPQVKWGLVENATLDISNPNNAEPQTTITTTYTPKNGYAYAIVVAGQIGFTRNGIRYLQDANYVCSSAVGDTAPTWDRAYPPGTGPAINSAVTVRSGDWSYYQPVYHTWNEAVRDYGISKKHQYVFHANDPRLENSVIPNSYIPFVPSKGRKFDITFTLAGSGSISDITNGTFKVLIFESAIAIDQFYAFGGATVESDRYFFVTHNDFGSYTPGTHYLTFTAEDTNDNTRLANAYQPWSLTIKAPATKDVTLRIKTDYYITDKTGVDMDLLTDMWAKGELDNGGGTAFLYSDQVPGRTKGSDVVTLEPNQSITIDLNHQTGTADATIVAAERSITVDVISTGPENPQVPVPSSMALTIPAIGTIAGGSINNIIQKPAVMDTKGSPMIMLSTQPYSAWNFEVIGRYLLKGRYSAFGLIGLANDGDNYLVGYVRYNKLYIAKVRGGTRTILASVTISDLELNKVYDLRFWHRDGLLGVEIKRAQDYWPARESQLTYIWTEADDVIAPKDDVFHVGVYSYIDPPRFRIVAHKSQSKQLGVMPGDYDPTTGLSDFPSFPKTGKLEIDKVIYNYASKIALASLMGPFDLRNVQEWKLPFIKDPLTGYQHQGGKAIELLDFYWWDEAHVADYANKIMASADGDAWLNEQTQWRVWITTSGDKVYLRNRSRWYSTKLPEYLDTGFNKVYVTKGLNNMALDDTNKGKHTHSHGTFAYLHNEDVINLYGFTAFNGEHDLTIAGLIQKFSRVAGTDANMLGDTVQVNPSEETVYIAQGSVAFQSQTTDAILLSQVHNLTVQDAAQSQSEGNPALTQVRILGVQTVSQPQSAQNMSLIRAFVLGIQNMGQGQSADNVTIIVGDGQLTPQTASQPQSAENVALTQQHSLIVQGAAQPQSNENVSLTQIYILGTQNISQGQSTENIAGFENMLVMQAGGQAQSTENVTLTQQHLLAPQTAAESQSAGNISLIQDYVLGIQTAAQAQTATNIAGFEFYLSIQTSSQAQATGNALLVQQHTLVTQNIAQVQSAENVTFVDERYSMTDVDGNTIIDIGTGFLMNQVFS